MFSLNSVTTRKHSSRMHTACFFDSGGSGQRPPGQRPLEGTWDHAARQEVTLYRDTPCTE